MTDFALSRRGLMQAGAIAGLAALPGAGAARRVFAGPRQPIGINLYVVAAEVRKDPAATLRALAAIGYREVETGLDAHDAATMARAITAAGMRCASLNLLPLPQRGGRSFADDAGLIAQDARTLGAHYVTSTLFLLPPGVEMRGLPGETVPAMLERVTGTMRADDWKRTADWLNQKGAALKRHGAALAYHNHNPELAPQGEANGLSILLEHTDPALVHFHMDAGWVVAAGHDPVTILRAYPGRFRLMHVKDIAPTHRVNTGLRAATTEVGSGIVDWPRVLAAARTAGVRHFAVEQEPPYTLPPLESAARSYAYLRDLDLGSAR
ncbi:sugar phosphate isomerase/epimerase [Sphingobium sufflavum]|uniref:sugar phosphate isomerase/epimerase family protein n=1 Tax=Sphingobium sufflavum TaxID=1129547 RepID=UPI001F2F61A9|nr:sugar phosphate isomerase/epimerase [Sphingobium sufflavum]MCE7796392.1 sugar phosphate isomerase/epimerase [Sphingobium sufflavum]